MGADLPSRAESIAAHFLSKRSKHARYHPSYRPSKLELTGQLVIYISSMSEPSGPSADADPRVFDVPRWLGEITGHAGWSVQRTFTRHKVEFVADYRANGDAEAEVTLQALPAAHHPSWQLVAKAGPQVAGIVIPARTRITW